MAVNKPLPAVISKNAMPLSGTIKNRREVLKNIAGFFAFIGRELNMLPVFRERPEWS